MTTQYHRVSVVIPALNEETTIGDVVQRILNVDPSYEVIVVDDGSRDGTATAASRAGAKVIRHPYNLGNGASITSGSRAASGDVIVMIDADGQHPPEEIPTLLSYIGEYDMVVAARTRKSRTSKLRNVGNFALNAIARWISNHPIKDLTSGFRAIKREHLLEYIHMFPARYSYPTTITMAMIQGRHFLKYVPMDEIKRRHHGKSNIQPMRDFIRFVNIMMRLLILFSPQKFFLPLSSFTFLAGSLMALHQILTYGGIFGSSQLMLLSAAYFFCFGLLAEQLAAMRREKNERPQSRPLVEPAKLTPRSELLQGQTQGQVEIDNRQEVERK